MELKELIQLIQRDLERLQTIGHVSNKVRLELIASREKQLKYLWNLYKNEYAKQKSKKEN